MSNHPYRQKVTSLLPYPINEIDDSANSTRVEERDKSYESPISRASMKNTSDTHLHNSGALMTSPYGKSNLPYPSHGSNTPPPVFAKEGKSPPSNPLSATSSVTNLYSSYHIDNLMNFKSDSNLPNLKEPTAFGHNRSVSSTSSFFYDKSDNVSVLDFNQNHIQQFLGSHASNLLPRIKTIEMYRKNAKKSNDPTVLFQYAQYMLQTALLLDVENSDSTENSILNNLNGQSLPTSPTKFSNDMNLNFSSLNLGHKVKKSASLDDFTEVDEKKLKSSFLKEAMFYLKKLADKGYVDAQYLLADAYSSGALGKVLNKEAFILFQSAAKHGHIESAYRTSYCYEEGLGTGRDARKAIEYLKMAASKNHPSSMYKLGIYSFNGRMGLPNDMNTKKMGIKWLTRASNCSNELIAAAPYELGKIYFDGFEDIIIKDQQYALELYSKAAALGHIKSAAILGKCYEMGDIVPQDSNLSIHYYTQAALGGDPESMLAMCAWYLVGNEPYLPKDEGEAFEWTKRAALCDLPRAQFALATFYEKGIGCTQNPSEAQEWYKKAATNGDEKALSRIHDKEFVSKIGKRPKKVNKKSSKASILEPSKLEAAQEKDCIIM